MTGGERRGPGWAIGGGCVRRGAVRRWALAVAVLAVLLTATACGGDGDSGRQIEWFPGTPVPSAPTG